MIRPSFLRRSRAARRGSALILVLLMTVTLAAIALSAILLTGSGSMLTKYYDRERDYRYAAEAALAMGKARLLKDTTVHLPDSGYTTLLSGGTITGGDGQVIPRVKVNLYAGLSGNTTGEFGKYASVVAEAYDAGGTRFVRRLEMEAENFARYAMFTDTWQSGLCYATGEFIRGRAHSNQNWGSCGSPTYYDTVSAVGSVSGGSPTFMKGYINGATVIPIPPVSRLAILHTRATDGYLDVVPLGNDLSTVRTRIEFVPVDLNADSNITDPNEGFFRVYQSSRVDRARVNPMNYSAGINSPPDSLCGDWHVDSATKTSKFYPVAIHNQAWFRALFNNKGLTDTVTAAGVPTVNQRDRIMANANFRCYPGGDPHLVAIERSTKVPTPANSAWQKGGEDTTFTDSTAFGYWQRWTGDKTALTAALAAIPADNKYRGYNAQLNYLWPLYRTLNGGSHGVIHVHGPVLLNGILRGQVTIYAQTYGSQQGYIGYVDDLVYAQDPAAVLCANLFGAISDVDQMVLDNAINSPQRAGTGKVYRWTDGDDNGMLTANDFVLHGVTMSRTGTVGVENYGSHPEALKGCNGANSGRGCIRQAGGVIEEKISATFTGNGDGYGENRSVDACLTSESPPYFPTTGRYSDNRFYEIDPARYNITSLFTNLQGGF
ncbi:MAG TPA: hypothetical protein VEI06_09800 [Gemmatimonadaceae bacterium]|nr:hypothetical protein [Gemmatimonadaceae bacterium]